ncbi:alanine racemase [Microbacterium terrae]|uniref:Alanine racemase n=1 Tax=Microbacterium terrae TaxID=69369 RepID=A0A0M2GWH4_9MICO|nr:alanine racemase [Microbacterium terrae]KJL37915.1 Alanine racemase [Microbacterium terrae]MBP1077324.1 alanine racemase [Microbacterium terrae]GLJ98935.1 alanine racemase [Microbacterium terrae]
MTTRMHVDLDALRTNIARVRETVAPAQLMIVVKDDAYGHGLEAVARTAATAGVTWFGAFDVRTGSAVRAAVGPVPRIFAWIAASRSELDEAIAADLDLGIGDSDLLEELAVAAQHAAVVARVHLKIDTGLHRNGVRPEHWSAFVDRAAALETGGLIEVVGVWSHIAEASDAEDDEARVAFEHAVAVARAAGLRPRVRHLAASAASFARPEFRYDMVRVGAFCYGIRSAGGPSASDLGVTPIARLDAAVTAVRGDDVHIALGGLQGLPTALRGRGAVVGTPAGARELRLVGLHESIVASWPGAQNGDAVTVYGPGVAGEVSATDLAELIGTIGEEIAVRVSPLIPRTYAGE